MKTIANEVMIYLMDLLMDGYLTNDEVQECIKAHHAYEPTPVYEDVETIEDVAVKVFQKCPKCNGKGKITCYSHVSGGACFKCGANGRIYVRTDIVTQKVYTRTHVHGCNLPPHHEYTRWAEFLKESYNFDYSTLGE